MTLLFDISAPQCVSFEQASDYARACKGSIVRLVHAASADKRFRISVEEEWLRFSLGDAAEEFRLDRALHFIITLDERVLGTSLATLRLAFRGIDEELGTLAVLTSPGEHRDWFRELNRKMQSASLPIPVKVDDERAA
jgi:hypothetical protein